MKRLKAFTLIETLIVIIVFCVGILTVLQWLSQTLRNKDYANTQIKSAFFAREWIELVFNMRDANYRKELPWNCIFKYNKKDITITLGDDWNEIGNSACDWVLQSWTILKIWIWNDGEFIDIENSSLNDDFDKNLENFQIYLHTWSKLDNFTGYLYNHIDDGGEETGFARYIKIVWVTDWGKEIDSDKLLKIESHVLYKRWYLTGEKVMETFIWNYDFNQ